ncbi:MAG TPA: CsbD family protein [Thermoanaerobaculia bacterium]|nr:CsbD family protein [Thermoanaerobaculia bacterium]
MAEDIFEGRWKQLKGEAKRVWGKLTDDDWDRAEGNRDKLVGSLQERYGWEKVHAESEFDRFLESVRTPAGAGHRTDDRNRY